MKIAITCFNLSWQAGGVRLIYSEAHALEKLGHKVAIYAPDFNPQVYPDLAKGLDIRAVPPPRPIFWQYKSENLFKRVLEKIERGRALKLAAKKIAEAMDADFDIVNIHDFSYLLAPLYKKRNPGAKIIWTMNDPPYMYLPKENFLYNILSRAYNAWKDISERRYFRFIDAVAVLVRRNREWAEERRMRAKVVWSGLEFDRFYAPPKRIEGKKKFTLLGVGALNKYRRFEDIIGAIRVLRARHIDIRALIICKNIWKEDAYAAELEHFARAEGVKDFVELRFEGATDEELRGLYASSDFFALPIHLPAPRNGFGWQLVPFEAMAAGTPVIVSNKIDVTEALRDNETACFVDPLSPDQIADKIEMLIKNPDLYFKIAAAGQKFVKENLTWEKYVKKIVEIANG